MGLSVVGLLFFSYPKPFNLILNNLSCLLFQIWKGHSTVKQSCQPVSCSLVDNLKSLTGVLLGLPLLIWRLLPTRESFTPQIKTASLPVDFDCTDCNSFRFPLLYYRKMPIRRINSLPVSRFVMVFVYSPACLVLISFFCFFWLMFRADRCCEISLN